MEIKNKIALVTGGASGLGRATTELLIKKGMRVVVFDLNMDNDLIETFGNDQLAFYTVDVTSAISVEEAFAEVKARFGSLHLCVNCAGIAPAKRVLDREGNPMPLEDFASVININLIGSFNVARCAAQLMVTNQSEDDSEERGVIINTASVAAYEGQIGQCGYAASKGGIVSLTLPLARDLAPSGIRVNAIAPGIMGTPMLLAMPEKVQQSLTTNVQFPKRLGLPEEFGKLVLSITENTYLNGEVIRIDGAIRMSPK